ncbi:hypothetical protein [Mucilaginibacter celer]|nr:hypothetical protein [Mucilaginibacter celer]
MMKKLSLLRLFSCLPLIAIIIPDVTELIINNQFKLPFFHIISGAMLIVTIVICTLVIRYLKKQQQVKMQYQQV